MRKQLEKPPGLDPEPTSSKTGIALRQDETAELARKREQARKMAQEKAKARTLAKQQAMAERIAASSQQLLAAVEETNASVQEFARLMTEVASMGNDVGQNAEQMRTGATRVNQVVEEFHKNLQVLHQYALSGVEAAERSRRGMETMMDQMKEAVAKNQQSGQRIKELEIQSEKIGDIVQAVVMIADQTNLLALNAAIEAARAGEHGRGFAVVADEVRNLAEISERSARDIRGVVEEIRSVVEEIVKDIGEVVNNFERLQDELANTNQGFAQVGQLFAQYASKIDEAVAGGVTMTGKAGELLTSGEAIASAALQIAGATQEAAKAVAEQTKALSEVTAATHDLTDMAEELRTSTNINKSAEEIAATAEQLSANIEEISSSATQIASGLNELTQSARIAVAEARKAQDIGQESQQLVETIAEISSAAGNIHAEIAETLEASRASARKVWAGIREGIASYSATNSAVASLQDKIRRIEKIVDTIENVSIQTNMLAVNGFVEAATAGEHGRGFSVVANDIRNLATESAENADKIKDLVRDIQIQIGKVVGDISQSEAACRKADETAGMAAKSNQQATDQVNQIGQLRVLVGKSISELRTVVAQGTEVATAAADILAAAFSKVEEASVIAQEQAKAVQELANSIEEIASIADEMQMN
ncbi:MAG: chemotaxis protein [Syntrophothermus sp.]|uniref:methyl-accepting chemotaxis protein n=1 Tax=Syntrophothermus sp. TaxID=2736299 RepID=UPI00257AE95F|nr:methyl-accepting chemotaxis protein [Syntrophothermus sp.]NSW83423.1 chemotaxis protein [Syntrophothermus sp.]